MEKYQKIVETLKKIVFLPHLFQKKQKKGKFGEVAQLVRAHDS